MLDDKKLDEMTRQSLVFLKSLEALRDESERDWALAQREKGAGSKETRDSGIVASELGDACREMKRAVNDIGSAAARRKMASLSSFASEVMDAVDQDALRELVSREARKRMNGRGLGLEEPPRPE